MAKKFTGDKVRICVDVTKEDYDIVRQFNQDNIRPLSLPAVCEIAIKKAINDIKEEMDKREQKKDVKKVFDTLESQELINTHENTVKPLDYTIVEPVDTESKNRRKAKTK